MAVAVGRAQINDSQKAECPALDLTGGTGFGRRGQHLDRQLLSMRNCDAALASGSGSPGQLPSWLIKRSSLDDARQRLKCTRGAAFMELR